MAQHATTRIDGAATNAERCFRDAGRKLYRRHGFTEEQARRNAAKLHLTDEETEWLLAGWREEREHPAPRRADNGGRR